jgi:hypothetical protein
MKTTAQLRKESWEAQENCEWLKAANLLREAIEKYPKDLAYSTIAHMDKENMKQKLESLLLYAFRELENEH